MSRKTRKPRSHVPRRKTQGPPPRAAFAVDAVLQRRVDKSIVDVKKLYVGPKGLDPMDLVDLMSAVVAGAFVAAIKKEEQDEARDQLLGLIDRRIRGVVRDIRGVPKPDTALNNEAQDASEEQQEK